MKRYQPALFGGLFIGILSSLPMVSMCCCLWMVVGGALTVYLQQQSKSDPVEAGEAVLGGLIAGFVGAVISTTAMVLMFGMGGAAMQEQIRQAFDQMNELPPETRATVERMLTGSMIGLFLGLFNLIIYPLFAMLGALLGLAIFKKKTPPPAPPMGEVPTLRAPGL